MKKMQQYNNLVVLWKPVISKQSANTYWIWLIYFDRKVILRFHKLVSQRASHALRVNLLHHYRPEVMQIVCNLSSCVYIVSLSECAKQWQGWWWDAKNRIYCFSSLPGFSFTCWEFAYHYQTHTAASRQVARQSSLSFCFTLSALAVSHWLHSICVLYCYDYFLCVSFHHNAIPIFASHEIQWQSAMNRLNNRMQWMTNYDLRWCDTHRLTFRHHHTIHTQAVCQQHIKTD